MKANDPEFYLYVYFRLNGSPCYIGKGCGQRWLSHEQKNRCSNHRLRALIERAGGELPKLKIREGLTNDEASAMEIAFIAAIGRGRKGPLVNMTDGGEGTVGNVLSAESR